MKMSAAGGGVVGLRPCSNPFLTSWKGVLIVLLVFNAKSASANPFPDMSEHLDNMFPTKNVTGGPIGEIQCYALPYGAIGMISHLFTYWTIAWMGVGRTPMWPFHKMDHSKFDIALSAISLLTCIPVATISIHRCRLSWHFILIGIWKLTTSVTQGCVAVHRALITRKANAPASGNAALLANTTPYLQQTGYHPVGSPNPQQQRPGMYRHTNTTQHSFFHSDDQNPPQALAKAKHLDYAPLWWLILYFLGTITGMVGLFGLIIADFRHNSDVRSLTYSFLVIVTVRALTTGTYWYTRHIETSAGGYEALKAAYIQTFGGFFIALLAAFGFFSALYSDLVLGAIAQNWSGFPSRDNQALYWAWFAAKRLPMFSH